MLEYSYCVDNVLEELTRARYDGLLRQMEELERWKGEQRSIVASLLSLGLSTRAVVALLSPGATGGTAPAP